MSTAVHWHDIDDALAADFDGSLSGLGMELGTSSFNMSETLLALPSLKSEHTNYHHRSHLNHQSNGNSSDNSHQSSPHHKHSIGTNSNIKGSNSESSSLSLSLDNPLGDDGRGSDIIVHRKKNRLAYGLDEESMTSTIKRFCFSNERETCNSDSMRYIFATHGLIQRGSDGDCQHEECKSEMKCQQRHSISAPDLRTTSASSILPHSGRSSPSAAISSPSSVLTQILSVSNHHPFGSSSNATTATNTTSSNHHHHHIHQQQQQHHHHLHQHNQHHQNHNATSSSNESESPSPIRHTNEFLYLLQAPTSMATKVNEETMTYLNQGQSYEINLKKLGDLSDLRGKMLKSIIRIGFHERRLQYMEKDLILQWKQSRQSERILEIDIPLSYGIYENQHNSQEINKCEFLWEPTKDTGVFVRVNCISTEFTPKKHGGEKGVPFRLIIETHAYDEGGKLGASSILHAASCQIKVFKPKGADRKHKTDREKMSKRPQSEQEKFKPSSDRTAFTEYPFNSLYTATSSINSNSGNRVSNDHNGVICGIVNGNSNDAVGNNSKIRNSSNVVLSRGSPPSSPTVSASSVLGPSIGGTETGGVNLRGLEEKLKASSEANNSVVPKRSPSLSDDKELEPSFTNNNSTSPFNLNTILSSEASSEETANWLALNRFDSYVRTFSNFSGSDLLRMTRSDLIQICGLTDGIRLFNALHIRAIKPKLTLYICNPVDEVFRAVYLDNLSVTEFKAKLESVILCSNEYYINRICLQGPSGIHVLMTDEVIRNFTEESIFLMQLDRVANDGTDECHFEIILKPYK